MSSYVSELAIEGLYGSFDLSLNFASGVNVIYGRNGSFKTTILHVLANILNGDYDRFAFLDFDRIEVEFDDGNAVNITRDKVDYPSVDYQIEVNDGKSKAYFSTQEIESQEYSFKSYDLIPDSVLSSPSFALPNLPVMYYPAFRMVMEVWKSVYMNSMECSIELMTVMMRHIYSPFVPRVNYPSLHQIENELVIDGTDLRENIANKEFEDIVNELLEGKQLSINPTDLPYRLSPVDLIHTSGQRSRLAALSSGEKQVLTMLFATLKSSSFKVFLIDEPEISLHVSWQRILLDVLGKLSRSQQIIVSTHSPVIGANHPYVKIDLVSYDKFGEDMAW